jgi:hypothetical protein
MTVPKAKSSGPRKLSDVRSPPATPFAMMAAAQMHSEGRLIPNADGTPALPPQLGGPE